MSINAENNIAIGASGLVPTEENKKKLFKISHSMIRLTYSGLFNDAIPIEDLKEFLPEINTRIDFIGITSNKAFLFRDGIFYPQTGFMAALGTGSRSIIACYYVTKDICEAFRLSSECNTLSSPNFMTIMADRLTPYVME